MRLITICLLILSSFSFAEETIVKPYFTKNALEESILNDIEEEKYQILIASRYLTSRPVINALIGAKKRGVIVEVIVDHMKVRPKSAITSLTKCDIPVFLFQPNFFSGKLSTRKPHLQHRFCIFSDKVWVGNFSFHQKKNPMQQESAVVIQDQGIVKEFSNEFERLKDHMCQRGYF